MRFGIVTRFLGCNDGQGRVNFEIAREALRQGHEICAFCEQTAPDTLAVAGIRPILFPPPRWLPTRLLRDQVFALRSMVQLHRNRDGCDAVLVNGFSTWSGSDVNAAHFVHGAWRRSPYHPWHLRRSASSAYALLYSNMNVQLEKMSFRRSGRVVAVSERVREELIGIGVKPGKIVTIPNGVDTVEFAPGPSCRDRFGLPGSAVVALFAGDLMTPRKNLETVLRALQHVPGLHLAVAGQTEGSIYPALAVALEVADRVHFLGFQSDMPALMRSVDLFVLPSRYEPFGLVLLEAMASGVPVVMSGNVGGATLIDATVGVLLADSNDDAALAKVLRELAADPDRRKAMAAAARSRACRYSWDAMARQYVTLLVEVAAARQRVAR